MKPDINFEYSQAKIVFRPWTKRISSVICVIDLKRDIMEQLDEIVEDWKKEGKHKQRTIIQFIVLKSVKIKL